MTDETFDRNFLGSTEAEEAVLAIILLDERNLPAVSKIIKSEDFLIVRHGWIFEAMLALFERDEPVEVRTLAEEMRKKDRCADQDIAGYLNGLIANFLGEKSSYNAEVYARIVERYAIRRKIVGFAERVASLTVDRGVDTLEVINTVEQLWSDIRDGLRAGETTAMRETVDEMYRHIVAGSRQVVQTTFVDLDEMLSGGLRPGRIYAFCGTPGSGKTTLMVSLARNIAYRLPRLGRKIAVLIISYEMSRVEIAEWMVAGGMRFPASEFWKLPSSSPATQQLFADWADWVAKLPVYIIDATDTGPAQIQGAIVDLQREGYEVVWFVDHINRASTGIQRLDTEEKEYPRVSYLARVYKNIARTTKTPGVYLVQLNRNPEARQDKRPTQGDIRGSGRIVEELDGLFGLYVDKDEEGKPSDIVELITLKNRQGPGDRRSKLAVSWEHTRFYNMRWLGEEAAGPDYELEEELDRKTL